MSNNLGHLQYTPYPFFCLPGGHTVFSQPMLDVVDQRGAHYGSFGESSQNAMGSEVSSERHNTLLSVH